MIEFIRWKLFNFIMKGVKLTVDGNIVKFEGKYFNELKIANKRND